MGLNCHKSLVLFVTQDNPADLWQMRHWFQFIQLMIKNQNLWQSLLPDYQEWQWTAFAILAMFVKVKRWKRHILKTHFGTLFWNTFGTLFLLLASLSGLVWSVGEQYWKSKKMKKISWRHFSRHTFGKIVEHFFGTIVKHFFWDNCRTLFGTLFYFWHSSPSWCDRSVNNIGKVKRWKEISWRHTLSELVCQKNIGLKVNLL